MAYSPLTDFLALLRTTAGGVRVERMPGLDFVVAALARAGLVTVYVGQVAPNANQSTTVWLRPATPSWNVEGAVFLWNSGTVQYELATPALWNNLIAPGSYNFQSAPLAANIIAAGRSLVAVQRAAPVATALVLPGLGSQFPKSIKVVDFSTLVVGHTITITPSDASTIMGKASWQVVSTADQLAGLSLYPSPDLNAWVIAP